jgi:membrane-bound lytic murein transglycosylase D
MSFRSYLTFITLIMTILLNPFFSFSQVKRSGVAIDTDFPLPDKMTLCNESMPLNDPWAWEMLDRELTIAVWDKEQTFMWLKRAGRYFPYIEKKLAQNSMPDDLKYLVVAESSLLSHVKSEKGAIGLWQFMTETAKKLGLRSDKYIDERRDLEESTEAALTYLKKLKDIFGTWSLAMAAYNCGENRLAKEIEDQEENDFYSLKLPNETERYVFRIAAIKLIMENPERYGYQVSEVKIYRPIKCDTIKVNLKKSVHITDFAKAIGTTFKVIRYLNPHIIDDYLPAGAYNLNVPSGTGPKAINALHSLSSKSASIYDKSSSKYYVVQEGDTLTGISSKTGVSLDQLTKKNNLKVSIIKIGDELSLE